MTGAAAWMMTRRWDWPHMALLFAMLSAMMVGMMVPSAVAAIVGYGQTLRGTPTARVAPMGVFVAAYVLVWMLFSLAATLTHRVLYALHLLSPMMEPATTTWRPASTSFFHSSERAWRCAVPPRSWQGAHRIGLWPKRSGLACATAARVSRATGS
jgi:hypothetical protein